MTFDEVLAALGPDWRDTSLVKPATRHKMFDRVMRLRGACSMIERYLPDYTAHPGRAVLDLSCGGGALIEILRHHGHEVMGTDVQYFEYLRSQGIPHQALDGNATPYPFESQGYDLVTNIGAITFLEVPWGDVLGEMFRIARRTVLLVVNKGHILDENRHILDGWSMDGWQLTTKDTSGYRWDRAP